MTRHYGGVAEGLQAGLEGYLRGKGIRADEATAARKAKAEQFGLDRMQTRADQQDAAAAREQTTFETNQRSAKNDQTLFDQQQAGHRRSLEKEGFKDALFYMDQNQPERAMEAYNTTGSERIKSLIPHPDDRNGDLFIYETADGDKGTIDRRELRKTLAGPQKAIKLNKNERLVQNGKEVIPAMADEGLSIKRDKLNFEKYKSQYTITGPLGETYLDPDRPTPAQAEILNNPNASTEQVMNALLTDPRNAKKGLTKYEAKQLAQKFINQRDAAPVNESLADRSKRQGATDYKGLSGASSTVGADRDWFDAILESGMMAGTAQGIPSPQAESIKQGIESRFRSFTEPQRKQAMQILEFIDRK